MPPREPTVKEQMEAYRKEHEVCPECGEDNYETTCMGFLGGQDWNRVRCMCGWKGIGHELVPRKLLGMPIVYTDSLPELKEGDIQFGDGKVRQPVEIKQEDGRFVMRRGGDAKRT